MGAHAVTGAEALHKVWELLIAHRRMVLRLWLRGHSVAEIALGGGIGAGVHIVSERPCKDALNATARAAGRFLCASIVHRLQRLQHERPSDLFERQAADRLANLGDRASPSRAILERVNFLGRHELRGGLSKRHDAELLEPLRLGGGELRGLGGLGGSLNADGAGAVEELLPELLGLCAGLSQRDADAVMFYGAEAEVALLAVASKRERPRLRAAGADLEPKAEPVAIAPGRRPVLDLLSRELVSLSLRHCLPVSLYVSLYV